MLYVISQIENDVIIFLSYRYVVSNTFRGWRIFDLFYFQEASFRSGNNEHASILKNHDDLFQQRKINFNERLNVVAVCYPSNPRGPTDLSKIAKFLIICS